MLASQDDVVPESSTLSNPLIGKLLNGNHSEGASTCNDDTVSDSDKATSASEDGIDSRHGLDQSAASVWINASESLGGKSRRSEVLRRVCAHILALASSQRPKGQQALSRTLRKSLIVKSFTMHLARIAQICDPQGEHVEVHELLSALPVPPQLDVESLEDETDALTVLSAWNKARDGIQNNFRSLACWFASQAFTTEVFQIGTVEEVLRAAGLLTIREDGFYDWSKLTFANRDVVLGGDADIAFQVSPWDLSMVTCRTERALPLPCHCVSAFIGKAGTSIRKIESIVQSQLRKAGFFKYGITLSISVVDRANAILNVRVCAAAFAVLNLDMSAHLESIFSALRAHIAYLRLDAYAHSREKRQKRQQALSEAGMAYQEQLVEQRSRRRAQASAVRALTVPEGGLEIAEPERNLGTKSAGRHRQWRLLKDKRQTLLRVNKAVEINARAQHQPGVHVHRKSATCARRMVRQAAMVSDEDSPQGACLDHVSAASASRHIREAMLIHRCDRNKRGKPKHLHLEAVVADCVFALDDPDAAPICDGSAV